MPKSHSHGDPRPYWNPGKKLWIGRVDDGFHPDGRRRQREVSSTDKKEAERKLRRLRAQIEAGEVPDSTITFAQWVDQWWANGPGLSPHAVRDYRSALKVHILPVLGPKRMSMVQPADIQAVHKRMHKGKAARSSVLKVHRIMGSVWTAALINEKVKRDVVALGKPKRMLSQPAEAVPTSFTADQAIAVLDAAAQRDDYARWLVGFIYGARPGELFGALVEDLEPDLSGLTLRWGVTEANFAHGCVPNGQEPSCGKVKSGNCPAKQMVFLDGFDYRPLQGRFLLKRPKNGKPRFLPLVEPVNEVIAHQLQRFEGGINPHGLLWPQPDGWPRHYKADSQAWQEILVKADVLTPAQLADPTLRPGPYIMRHSAVTLMRRLGIPDTIIGAIVGHSGSRITDQYDDQSNRVGVGEAALQLTESLSR